MSVAEALGTSADGLTERIVRLLDLYPTRRAAAAAAGVSTDQITRYAQGRSAPPFEVMARLARSPGVSLDWLAAGQGEMRRGADPQAAEGLPVIGLAAAEEAGWYRPRTLGVRLPAPPEQRPDPPLAVLATDDTLLPEGVRAGFVCFAFPGIGVLEGDLAYVVRADGPVALRRYDGCGAEGHRLAWFDPSGERQADVLAEDRVEAICPVVMIRRKW